MNYKNNPGLTTSKITHFLSKFEQRLAHNEDKKKALAIISAILSTKTKEGVFLKKIMRGTKMFII